MFNTYNVSPRNVHHHSDVDVEITENRAPTDESVRLLREMEQAARAKVLDCIPLGNTSLDIKLLIESEHFGMEHSMTLLMKVNGASHRCKLVVPDDFRWMSKTERGKAIGDCVTKELAGIFLRELVRTPAALKQLQTFIGGPEA